MLVSPTTVGAASAAAPDDISAWLAGLRLEVTNNGIDAPSTACRQVIDPCNGRQIAAASPEADLAHLDR